MQESQFSHSSVRSLSRGEKKNEWGRRTGKAQHYRGPYQNERGFRVAYQYDLDLP